ncbi:unnamed protein product [Schistosoma rodhaini]|uniref:TIR domain-containing protein n=1 Tax=Schistosoma rodhaini TaxID=6188 RepID=A0AA85FIV4_9TREM|nr:unnamed protein product [Schistosoma rodhaini]
MTFFQHFMTYICILISNIYICLFSQFWIDKEHMVQDVKILDAMANAVENAAIVLILFSKSYQDSKNTRDEAERTRQLNKPAIFLRVEPKFVASGWLGFIMGATRYIDFSGKYPFEEKFEELCTTIVSLKDLKWYNCIFSVSCVLSPLLSNLVIFQTILRVGLGTIMLPMTHPLRQGKPLDDHLSQNFKSKIFPLSTVFLNTSSLFIKYYL